MSTLPRHWDVFFMHHLRVPRYILKRWKLCLALTFWKENRFRKSLVKGKWLGTTELGLTFGSLCCNSPCFYTYTRGLEKFAKVFLSPGGRAVAGTTVGKAPKDPRGWGERLVKTYLPSPPVPACIATWGCRHRSRALQSPICFSINPKALS